MVFFLFMLFVAMITPVFADTTDIPLHVTVISIPGGQKGIGFDDLVYSSQLHKVLVPGGYMGKLYLIDPVSFKVDSIGGFSSSAVYQRGRSVGISSADTGEDFIFTADHGTHELDAVDLNSGHVVARADLVGDADYVRYTGVNHEIWVTQPHEKMIEVFKFSNEDRPMLGMSQLIPVPKEPESLVIDHLRGRAYTNLGRSSVAIDLGSHAIVSTWPNGCAKSRGDALDEKRGFLFVSCKEGKAVVFDLNHGNKKLSELLTDPGPDVISYNDTLAHLYLTSSLKATLSIFKVSAQGELSLINQAPADEGSHCVVSDDQNNIWVCDPFHGQLLSYQDLL